MNWGLDENAVVFGFAGKFIEKKRPLDFLQAVRQAALRNSRIQGLMIGDGPLRTVCEEFGRNRQNPVRYTGFLNQSHVAEAYVACDALVLPSDGGETWGLVVNEAMACGRPCLVSDRVGCGPDLISSGQTGAVFPLGDVNAITAAMLQMASDPVRMAAMSAEATRRIQTYSVQVAVNGVVQCLTTMLDPHVLYATAN
jgi:glycosyltransferase involved in cell wall biosynthesis